LIHPQNDFGWLGRGLMGSKSCIRLVGLLLWMSKKSAYCETSFLLSQNPSVQSPWHPNHCFSTIPNHLIHPQNDFGWLGRGPMGSISLASGSLGCCAGCKKNQLTKHHFLLRIKVSKHHGTQTIAP
jgi:hypothetical protein